MKKAEYGAPLSPREIEVADLLADGHTQREVAETLNIGVEGVKSLLRRVHLKLGVRNRAELCRAVFARRSS